MTLDLAETFYTIDSSKEILQKKNAKEVIVRMWDSNFDECLNDLRFIIFEKHTFKCSFKLESLLPTAAAAAQHAFRAYF